jgi:hypothetical protein
MSNLLRARSVSVNRNSTDDLRIHLGGREISSEPLADVDCTIRFLTKRASFDWRLFC